MFMIIKIIITLDNHLGATGQVPKGPLQWQYELRACVLVLPNNQHSYI